MKLVTCLGFEPRACIYLAALTTKSSQLVELKEEMVKVLQWADDQDLNLGHAIYLAVLTTESSP